MSVQTQTGLHTNMDRKRAAACGMGLAIVARENPNGLAIASPVGDRSFDFLNARTNQLVRALRTRGVRAGDAVALICSNRPEFAVAVQAALRGGFRLTPINWHLAAPEIAYIVENCEARAVLADSRFGGAVASALRTLDPKPLGLAIGDPIHGLDSYDGALEIESPHDLEDPVLGHQMLYTSGTTGRPKGVYRTAEAAARRPGAAEILKRIAYTPGRDLHLATGPLYHAAPLAFSLVMPLASGCGVVMMDGWDAERALGLIGGYRVSHSHMVPIMFQHLLALSEEERGRYDLSSLRMLLHGAAPCAVSVKQRLLDWLGPIVYEYYAATEGWGSFVTPEEWLERPGTVGRPDPTQLEVRDDEGRALPAGESGEIYLRRPETGGFEYFKDSEKTANTYAGDFFTLGDIGYLDDAGYLFLNDRSADVIISGGVNIYPAEVDAVLVSHPHVRDVATVGAPDEEWGESVISVVELEEGIVSSAELVEELIALCREQLAHFKCPRRIEFTDILPRSDAGKILRRLVRNRYWQGRDARI